MSDGLTVSTGGVAVVTEELVALAAAFQAIASEASAIRSEVIYADALLMSGVDGIPVAARGAEGEIDRACTALLLVEAEANFVALALNAAAGGYSLAEDAARQLVGAISDQVAMGLGFAAPLLTVPLLIGAGALLLAGPEGRNAFLSNPAIVSAIRALVMGADDAILGRLGLPAPLIQLLGDQGLGIGGIPLVAGGLAGLARGGGLLRESDVRVTREQYVVTGPQVSPSTFADRFDRIPLPDENGGAQVRIETYEMPDGSNRYEVYVAATVDFDPAAEGEPFDMASNVSNAIGPGSGSYDAVAAAMERAGIGPDDPVQFTGYSQGGGTAAQLAASGDYTTHGLVTFGGATGQVPIPSTVPTVIVEHTDDLVAALGGRQDNEHAVVVERWASESTDFSTAPILPGHQRPSYVETAGLMDASSQPRLQGAADSLSGFTKEGRLVSTVEYATERVGD